MKTIILAGGKGLRYNSDVPKALAMIGDKPIIEHVMEIYYKQGYRDFILALGYKKEKIIEYFEQKQTLNYNVQFVDTGEESNTAHRIKLIKDYIPEEDTDFFCNYSDGLANVDLELLYYQHKKMNSIITLTAVRPHNPYGILDIDLRGRITRFQEKPKMKEYINGGFFLFRRDIFEHITNNNEDLEITVLPRLCYEGKLGAYKHEDFWNTLNNQKDEIRLNKLYDYYTKRNITLPWYNSISKEMDITNSV